MDLQTLGNLGEFIGGIAVIATLVYLAIQMRQNTKILHSNSMYQALDPMWDMILLPAQESDLARLIVKGLNDFGCLDDEERFRFMCWAMDLLYSYDNMVGLYEAGIVDDKTLENAIVSVNWLFSAPGLREYSKTRTGPKSLTLEKYLNKYVGPPGDSLQMPNVDA